MRREATQGLRTRVVLFGEALLDEATDGAIPGGAPFNVACHLGRLGFRPLLVTRVGADAGRRALLRTARAARVALSGFQVDRRRPTARARMVRKSGGTEFRIPEGQAFDAIDAAAALSAVAPERPRFLYFGTFAQRSARSRAALDALLALEPLVTFLDVNLRRPWWDADVLRRSLGRARFVKANEEELDAIASALSLGGRNTCERARALLNAFPCDRLVVTRGAAGAVLFSRDRRRIRARRASGRPLPGPPVDTVGAGDGFSAVLIAGLLLGWTPAVTLARANRFGAALCTVRGALPASDALYAPFRRNPVVT